MRNKMLWVILIIFTLLNSFSFAGTIGPITEYLKSSADTVLTDTPINIYLNVATNDIVYTRTFDLEAAKYFTISYQASQIATPYYPVAVGLKIQLEQSYQLPSTQGGFDANYTIPSGIPDIETSLTDTSLHIKSFSPMAMPYGRFKITGIGGSNNGGTRIQMRIGIQRDR